MVSVNAMDTTEVETYAKSLLTNGEEIAVNVSINGGNVTSTVLRPTEDVARFVLLAWAVPNIVVSTTQRIEPTA